MQFIERHENADLIYVAECFAEALSSGDWEAALRTAQIAEAVSQGAFLVAERPGGECRAITRDYQYCPHGAKPGEPFCGLHARYIAMYNDRKELSSG